MALPPRLLSICAGVGGLDLGVRLACPTARSVCMVEREAYAAAVLVARMEDGWLHPAAIWSDLATFDPEPWRGAVDIVVSGDPCQPNSVAGRGLGADDDRWLIDHVVDIFDRSGATRLFRENVPGNADGQLAALVPALERLGCRVAVGIFSAKECGFSHGRERLFVMADREGDEGRLYEGQGRSGEGSADAGGCRTGLGYAVRRGDGGNAPDTRRCTIGRDASDWAGDSDSRREMEHALGPRWAPSGTGRAFDAGSEPEPGGVLLEHAARLGPGEGRPEHAGIEGRCADPGASDELAQPDDAHLQGGAAMR